MGEGVLRPRIMDIAADPGQALPSQGQLQPEQQEFDRLRREVATPKAERGSQKSRGLLCEGVVIKFGFVAEHGGIWPVRWLCEALGVSRSGFHA